MKKFTEEELTKYDGKNGRSAYVGYKGKVYNVSNSFLWQDGSHQVLHYAGVDLTEALEQAPHNAEVLKRFRVVGILRQARAWNQRVTRVRCVF